MREDINQSNIKEKIVRLLLFITLSYVMLRYCLGLNLSDIDQTKIVAATSVCFMFVSTYYPEVVTK